MSRLAGTSAFFERQSSHGRLSVERWRQHFVESKDGVSLLTASYRGGCVSVVGVCTLTAASTEDGFLYIQPGALGCVGFASLMIHVHRIILLSIKHSTRTLHLPASFFCLLFDFPGEEQRTGMRTDRGKAQSSFSSRSKRCLCPWGLAERRLFIPALIFQSLVSRLRGGTCFKACRRVGESMGV